MTNEKKEKAKVKLSMDDIEEAVRFWESKGFNVLPFNTHVKVPNVPEWRNYIPPNHIPAEKTKEWIKNGTFNQGIAIMIGKVFNDPVNDNAKPLYGIGIDCDNKQAIDLVLETLGYKSISEAAKHLVVNQHNDDKDRAHFICYSDTELDKLKIAINPALQAELKADPTLKEPPRLEIQGPGQLLAVPPSIHRNGQPYEIPRGGTMTPEVIDNLQVKFELVLKKYTIAYGKNGVTANENNHNKFINQDRIPVEVLFHPDVKIKEGDRENQAHRVAVYLLFNMQRVFSQEKIRKDLEDWNQAHCEPPLLKRDMDAAWKSAVKYVTRVNQEEVRQAYERHRRQKEQEDHDEYLTSELAKIEQRTPLTIAKLVRMNEEGKMHYAAGQITSLSTLHKRVRAYNKKCPNCLIEKEETFIYPVRYMEYLDYAQLTSRDCYLVNGGNCDGGLIVSPVYVSVIDIEVSDTTTLQDIDKLKYILFEKDTEDLGINENVTLLATVYMETPKKNGPTYPIAFTQKLIYEDREEEELTKEDIDKIKAFKSNYPVDNDLIREFVKMFAPGVFGHDNIKEGILYMATNAKPDKVDQKERLHGMIISEPGRAKTALLLAATKLMIKSTFETCQMATGLSLLFIVENREDMKITRTGPVARSLFASLDEFNRLSPEDRVKFLGGMQEGYFTNNKYGMNHKVSAPFTILASINPPTGSKAVLPDGRIDLSDLNVIPTVLDRFDFKWYIPPMKDKDFEDLVDKKIDTMDEELVDNSRFMKSWIAYSKTHFNPKLSENAKEILRLGIKDMSKNNKMSARIIDTMRNTIKARARFLLKEVADEKDAAAVINYFNDMMHDYIVGTIKPRDIIDIGTDECFTVLADIIAGATISYTVKELVRGACTKNSELARYIRAGTSHDDYLSMEHNRRVKNIIDRLLKRHPEIIKVGDKPLTLQIPIDKIKVKVNVHEKGIQKDSLSDTSDTTDASTDRVGLKIKKSQAQINKKSDTELKQSNKSERENQTKNTNQDGGGSVEPSDTSDTSDIGSKSIPINRKKQKYFTGSTGTVESRYKYPCPKCDFSDANPSRITEHIEEVHSNNNGDGKGFDFGVDSDIGGSI